MAQSEVKMEVVGGVRYRPEHVAAAKARLAGEPASATDEVTINADGSSVTTSTGPATEGALIDEAARDAASRAASAKVAEVAEKAKTSASKTTTAKAGSGS